VNIRSTTERDHKLRFLDRDKAAKVRYDSDKRREKSGRVRHRLHEAFASDALPDAADLKAWVEEYLMENEEEPNALLYPYFTKASTVIVFCESLQKAVSLTIKRSEFYGLDRITAD
jgi:hypothetical protein